MRVLCCWEVRYGMTICCIGRFWVSLSLDLLLAPPSDLYWVLQDSCYFGFMWWISFRIYPWISPCLHPRRVVYVRLFIFVLFVCGFNIFSFPGEIWVFLRGVCWGRWCGYYWVEPWQTSWCALWPAVFHPRGWICRTLSSMQIYTRLIP